MRKIVPSLLTTTFAAGGSAYALKFAGRAWNNPPPMTEQSALPVAVASAEVRYLPVTVEFPSFLEAPESVRLLPRVSGMIEAVAVPEGGFVRRGQRVVRLRRPATPNGGPPVCTIPAAAVRA